MLSKAFEVGAGIDILCVNICIFRWTQRRRSMIQTASQPWRANMSPYPQTRLALFQPASCYCFQLLLINFESGRLSDKVVSRQLLGARLQQYTSSDIDGGLKT